MTDPLIACLRAALNSEEATARTAAEQSNTPTWNVMRSVTGHKIAPGPAALSTNPHTAIITTTHDAYAEHIVRHNPARVLASVAARRAILDLHQPTTGWDGTSHDGTVCNTCAKDTQDGERDGDPYPCATVRLLAEADGTRTRSTPPPDWSSGEMLGLDSK